MLRRGRVHLVVHAALCVAFYGLQAPEELGKWGPVLKVVPTWYLAAAMVLEMLASQNATVTEKRFAFYLVQSLLVSGVGDLVRVEPALPSGSRFVWTLEVYLVAHLLCIWGLSTDTRPAGRPRVVIAAGLAAYLVAFLALIFPKVKEELQFPIMIYMGVVVAVGYYAFSRVASHAGAKQDRAVFGMAAAFAMIASDSLLLADEFLLRHRLPHCELFIGASHYLAQALFFVAGVVLLM